MKESFAVDAPQAKSVLADQAITVDHIAVAVQDLEKSIDFFSRTLGFELQERRHTEGKASGMDSAVLKAGPLSFVLLQGTSPESQVSQYLAKYGPGVQHIAISVRDLPAAVEHLKSRGLQFDTSIVGGPSLRQIFSRRDETTGLMFEILERSEEGFDEANVSGLFAQLEKSGNF